MPELPEVETIKLGLSRKIINKEIAEVEVLSAKSFIGDSELLTEQKVIAITRRAKTILFKFSNTNMLVHLKMTGQLIYIENNKRFAGGHPSHDWHANLPNKHTRIIFTFVDGSKLFFNDLRKFGWCKLISDKEVLQIFSLYGPEPFTKEFTADYLISRAAKTPNKKIKQFIMDQNVIAGIGNIYADESLFDSQIHPATRVRFLSKSDWEKFVMNVKNILQLAIENGGTTDSDYVDAEGKQGGMQNLLKVYHKTGQKCPTKCGGTIERIVIGGRGTNFCPSCQKELS